MELVKYSRHDNKARDLIRLYHRIDILPEELKLSILTNLVLVRFPRLELRSLDTQKALAFVARQLLPYLPHSLSDLYRVLDDAIQRTIIFCVSPPVFEGYCWYARGHSLRHIRHLNLVVDICDSKHNEFFDEGISPAGWLGRCFPNLKTFMLGIGEKDESVPQYSRRAWDLMLFLLLFVDRNPKIKRVCVMKAARKLKITDVEEEAVVLEKGAVGVDELTEIFLVCNGVAVQVSSVPRGHRKLM